MIRKAILEDADNIHDLISAFADKRVMLPRSLNFVYENIRDFFVYVDESNVPVGCVALHVVGWEGLAEVKSLSVGASKQKSGIGRMLVEACLNEAGFLGVKRVFALTFVPDFFNKCGFHIIEKDTLPHKIWTDCIDCPFFNNCKEIAVAITV
jgi:amino-acid N-acetyltransferase